MSEMKCKRCGTDESRIDGFCSIECRDAFDYEEEIAELQDANTELHSRIAELEAKIYHNALWQASVDAEERAHLEKLVPDLKKRIAELEEQAWNLNLENERMEEAYWIDETITHDGTLKPSVRKLLERLEKAETDLRLSDDLVKALDNRIAELEEKQRWIPVSERLPEIINGMEYYDAVVEGEEFVEIALWDGWHKTWNLYDGGDSYSCTTFVTHWRERPTLPEVYGKESEE